MMVRRFPLYYTRGAGVTGHNLPGYSASGALRAAPGPGWEWMGGNEGESRGRGLDTG